MMKLEYEPVKGQTFDIGRTINFTKCNCEKCDFMHCTNYAKKMKLKKFKNAKDFVQSWKEQNPEYADKVFSDDKAFEELTADFLDMMISFPKGLFWKPNHSWTKRDELIGIDIVRMSKTRYEKDQEGDFVSLADVTFRENYKGMKYYTVYDCYSYCTDRAEKLANKIVNELNEVFSALQTN